MPDRIPPHGTYGRYQGPRRHNRWQPCRCDLCRAAKRRKAKAQELRRLRGVASYIDCAPVAAHVRMLLNAKWDKVGIAEAAGVSRRTVFNVLHCTSPTVQLGTAQALLKLRPEAAPSWRPAFGAMRRVRALSAMGWPLWWTAEQAGLSGAGIRDVASGRTKTVSLIHFEAIDHVYRAHAMRVGPSEIARATARAKYWATAAAWNDIDDIDDWPHSVIGLCERRSRSDEHRHPAA